jgi:hypothetical protein
MSYRQTERCTLSRQYQRIINADLSFQEDIELTVRFNADIDEDRIIIDTESILAYRKGDPINMYHELILESADILRIEAVLEGESRSVIAEWSQDLADFHAESLNDNF